MRDDSESPVQLATGCGRTVNPAERTNGKKEEAEADLGEGGARNRGGKRKENEEAEAGLYLGRMATGFLGVDGGDPGRQTFNFFFFQ